MHVGVDCMNHDILWAKLHFYGVWGVSEYWCTSCLTNRRQQVEVTSLNSTQNYFSKKGTLKHGIPHGSILVPLMFVVYINELSLRINSISEPILFADTTGVILSSRNFEDFCSVSV